MVEGLDTSELSRYVPALTSAAADLASGTIILPGWITRRMGSWKPTGRALELMTFLAMWIHDWQAGCGNYY